MLNLVIHDEESARYPTMFHSFISKALDVTSPTLEGEDAE